MSTHQSTRVLYRRLLTYVRPFWPMLLLGVAANMLYSGVDAGLTYLLKPFLNKSFIVKDFAFIQYIPLIIFFGVAFRGAASGFGGYCMTYVARQVVKVFRQGVFQHILHLPKSYFDKSSQGQLLSKLLYDVEQVAQVSADALTSFVQSFCLVVGLLVVMFVISWRLSLLFLLAVPFIGLIVYYTNRRTRKVSHSVQTSMADVTDIAGEVIEGYQVVRLFGGETREEDKFIKATEESRRRDMKVAKIKVINVSGVQLVIAIGISVIVMTAIHLNSAINVSAGGFVSIVAAMLQLIKPMKNLSTISSTIQRGLAGAESVFNLFDTPLEADEGRQLLIRPEGQLEFRHVCFSYHKGTPVIKDLSLTIAPGQTVALVGRSGSGKSTLASLIPRFYPLDSGEILLDGVSIASLKLKNLRSHLSVVSQQVVLFNDTLLNNIAYGQENASFEEIKEAARLSYALDFIEALPNGFDTLVGENGLLLSGGQRQRIAIARAILKDAPVLILDEATSALDNHSEQSIQKALNYVKKGRTTLVIAHRLSTVEKADNIVVIDKGCIVEAGTHEALLKTKGYYSALYRMQFGAEEMAL